MVLTITVKKQVHAAHEQDGVRYVTAETLKENIVSQKVLKKIYMVRYSENAYYQVTTLFSWTMFLYNVGIE